MRRGWAFTVAQTAPSETAAWGMSDVGSVPEVSLVVAGQGGGWCLPGLAVCLPEARGEKPLRAPTPDLVFNPILDLVFLGFRNS